MSNLVNIKNITISNFRVIVPFLDMKMELVEKTKKITEEDAIAYKETISTLQINEELKQELNAIVADKTHKKVLKKVSRMDILRKSFFAIAGLGTGLLATLFAGAGHVPGLIVSGRALALTIPLAIGWYKKRQKFKKAKEEEIIKIKNANKLYRWWHTGVLLENATIFLGGVLVPFYHQLY